MGFEAASRLVVDVFRLHSQLLFAGFANPVMFAVNEGVIVDAFAVVVSAQIAFHSTAILSYFAARGLGPACVVSSAELRVNQW